MRLASKERIQRQLLDWECSRCVVGLKMSTALLLLALGTWLGLALRTWKDSVWTTTSGLRQWAGYWKSLLSFLNRSFRSGIKLSLPVQTEVSNCTDLVFNSAWLCCHYNVPGSISKVPPGPTAHGQAHPSARILTDDAATVICHAIGWPWLRCRWRGQLWGRPGKLPRRLPNSSANHIRKWGDLRSIPLYHGSASGVVWQEVVSGWAA